MKAGVWLELGRTHCRPELVDDLFQTVVPVIASLRLLQGEQHDNSPVSPRGARRLRYERKRERSTDPTLLDVVEELLELELVKPQPR